MVVRCQIDFDNNPYATYFAGQVVTGKVTLTAEKAKQVRGVSLKISGYAATSWNEARTHSSVDHHGKSTNTNATEYFSGREDYISSLTYLQGSDANQTMMISPGIHIYNFACHLPITCPSSFEGTYGHVRYIIRVALIRPWKFDQTFTKGFTVLKVMDLNLDSPLLRVPANVEIQKTYCCGPCRSKPMTINVSLGQSGYVPGQSIPVSVMISNDSNVPVEGVNIALQLLVCYYAQMPRSSCKNARMSISKLKGEGVPKHSSKAFQYDLPVPATPPTCFNLCRIIQIAYEVTVEAKVAGMHTNQVVATPVTIGNVPLMNVIQQQPTAGVGWQRMLPEPSDSNAVSTEMVDMAKPVSAMARNEPESNQAMPWVNNGSIPPPSYEEALHMPHGNINSDEKHDYGEGDFAPRYPVFNILPPSAPMEITDEIDGGSVTNDHSNGTWL